MRVLIVFVLSALWLAASGGPAAKSTGGARTIEPLAVPKRAVRTAPGTFRYTDARGKKWIYRQTPFGVARFEDKPQSARPAAALTGYDEVRAFDAGDSVRFTRPGPFGTYQWQSRKAELTEMERAAWQREQARAAAQD